MVVSLLLHPIDSKTISTLRKLYLDAAVKKESFDQLKSVLDKTTDNDPVLNGYRGCTLMIEANYLLNPISKLNYFNKGKEILEKAIKVNDDNIELRYLRFTIQSECPSILGYSDDLKLDKEFLLKKTKSLTDVALKKNIISFLKNSDKLTKAEKMKLNE